MRIINAGPVSQNTSPTNKDGILVVNGILDLAVLTQDLDLGDPEGVQQQLDDLTHVGGLLVPSYQRELIRGEKQTKLQSYLRNGGIVPLIALGMRSLRHRELPKSVVELDDPPYIIDGLQRCMAYQALCIQNMIAEEMNRRHGFQQDDEGYQTTFVLPPLGVTVYIGTTEDYERKLFDTFNFTQTTVSTNVRLANLIGRELSINAISDALNTPGCVLYDRVQWSQNRKKQHLVTARTVLLAAAALHGIKSNKIEEVVPRLNQAIGQIGRQQFIINLTHFFSLVNELWPFLELNNPQKATQIKEQFLRGFASFLCAYGNFWKQRELILSANDRQKLRRFKMDQPVQDAVASASGAHMIKLWLEARLSNNGTNRDALKPRNNANS